MYTIGIDPQPTCLGICVKSNRDDIPVKWFVDYFKRKSLFKKSSEWQKYLYLKCTDVINRLVYELTSKDFNLVIEQQRGRVNSIIENTLCCVGCRIIGCDNVYIVHPNTWKKVLVYDKDHIANGHYSNKKSSIRLVQKNDDLKAIIETRKLNVLRLADMCDAYWICKWYESQ